MSGPHQATTRLLMMDIRLLYLFYCLFDNATQTLGFDIDDERSNESGEVTNSKVKTGELTLQHA